MITLTLAQEQLIKSKVSTGQYSSPEEVIDLALRLLQFLDTESLAWLKDTRQKIAIGIEELDRGEGIDGTIVMNQLLQQFQEARRT
jgi:antitoxin ParD1/3/4